MGMNQQRGFTLLEVIFSLFLLSVAIVSLQMTLMASLKLRKAAFQIEYAALSLDNYFACLRADCPKTVQDEMQKNWQQQLPEARLSMQKISPQLNRAQLIWANFSGLPFSSLQRIEII